MDTQMDIFKEALALEDATKQLIASKFPVKLKNGYEVDIEGLKINRPRNFDSLAKQHKIKLDNNSLTGDVKCMFVIKNNGKIIEKSKLITIFELPYKTQRGTYVVGGNEKSITSQIRLKPGVYTDKKEFDAVTTIRVDNKKSTDRYIPTTKLIFNSNTKKLVASFDDKKIDGIDFLTSVAGLTVEDIKAACEDPTLFSAIKENKNRFQTKPDYVFNRLGEKEDNKDVSNILFSPSNFGIGQKSTTQNLGLDGDVDGKKIAMEALRRTLAVGQGNQEIDNKDDLRFKYVVNGEDLVLEQIEKQLDALTSKISKMSGNVELGNLQQPLRTSKTGFKSFLIGTAADAQGLVENPEQLNPLHNGASSRKVTQMGTGGMSSDAARNANETRDLQITGITRLDPIETPESQKIGLAAHLSQSAKVKNGTIYTKYHTVKNGAVNVNETVELSPEDEFDKYVAFYDPRHINKTDNTTLISSDSVPGRHKGKLVNIEKSKVQYIDPSPADIFGDPATLIPFGNHNDGNRMLMGASMQKQSVTLARDVREAPLVQSAIDDSRGKTYEEKMAAKNGYILKSPVDGTVEKVTDSIIEIKDSDGKVHTVEQYNYFPLNQGNFINNEPVVKAGDKVKSGQLLADGWQTKDGQLALGLNTRVAYLPYEGYNYEDGIVISESYAQRMKTEEIAVRQFEIKSGIISGEGSDVLKILKTETNCVADLSKLDASTGIIKKGAKVGPGDILVAKVKVKDNSNTTAKDQLAAKILYGDRIQHVDVSDRITSNEYLKGEVLDVSVAKGDGDIEKIVTIRIKTHKEMKLGDKVAGRHGNKGTITKILPDKQMPHDAQNRPVDLIFSPLAIPSRKNLGQLMEVNAGLIAEKEGKPWKVYNFDENDAKKVQDRLSKLSKDSNGEITEDGKTYLYDPTVKDDNGKPLKYDNPVTVGNMYVMKLKHKVDDKIQSRSGLDGRVNEMYLSPNKEVGVASGERRNPQSIGSMEMWGLESHGAAFNILESITLKGDGAGGNAERARIFSALASKDPSKIKELEQMSGQPESLKILRDNIQAIGLQVTPQKDGVDLKTFDSAFDALRLSPAKDSEVLKMIGKDNKVKNGLIYKIDKNGKDVPEDGGLFDTKIFGEDKDEQRSKWGYIELPMPMPLPALMQSDSYNPYKILTPFKEGDLRDIMNKPDVVVITDSKDSGLPEGKVVNVSEVEDVIFNEGKSVEFKAGGEAIKHYLSKIDLDAELEKSREALKNANASTIKNEYPKYKVLNNLKQNGLSPTDLVTNVVPVTPVYLRPRIQKGRDEMLSGTTRLYRNLANFAYDTNDVFEAGYKGDAFTEADANAKTYEMLRQLHGFGKPDPNSEDKGIAQTLGKKEGLVRDRMLGKQVDYSGRSVIGVDPSLNIDEAGLPYDMAKRIFLPFIIKELMNMGTAKNEKEAKDMVKNNHADVIKAMNTVAEERPILLNRAPSLHKFSIMAFKPKIIEQQDGQVVRNIYLNPLVTPGFNADFDGDSSVNSIVWRKLEVGIETLNMDNSKVEDCISNEFQIQSNTKENDNMPFEGNTKIRYKYGVINLRDFPRTELIKAKGNKEIYGVPDDVEVLTVWNGEKQWCPVESFSIHKDLNMLQVTTNTSRTIHVSDDHSLVTVDDNLEYKRDSARIGMTIPRLRESICTDDNVEIMNAINIEESDSASKYTLKTNQLPIDTNLGYLLGIYIGDGWVSDNYRISLSSNYPEMISVLKRILSSYINEPVDTCRITSNHEYKGYDCLSEKYTWSSKTFAKFIGDNIGFGARNKHLPEFWMHTDDKFKWGLLAGLIDTDGSVSTGRQCNINYTTTSRVLAYEVVALGHTLDLTASVTITQTPQGEECYVVTFTQESAMLMQRRLPLVVKHKIESLSKAKFKNTVARNKYTPKLSVDRLGELRKAIGSPRIANLTGEELAKVKKRKSLYSIVYRVAKTDTAITKDTALEIFDLNLDLFNNEFWAKWKSIVLDSSIEWELVTNLAPIPFITEAYDLTIPPKYTMVTESGFVIYDTMAVHAPLSDRAVEEAKTLMMPSQNLISPKNGKMVIEIRHEMALGSYYLTQNRKPKGKPVQYMGWNPLWRDYKAGKVTIDQAVTINGKTESAGMWLFFGIFPEPYRGRYMLKVKNGQVRGMGEKECGNLLKEIYDDIVEGNKTAGKLALTDLSIMINRVKDVSFKAATRSGLSVSIKDFTSPDSLKNEIAKKVEDIKKKYPNDEEARIQAAIDLQDELKDKYGAGVLGENNPVNVLMASGARGGADVIRRMSGFVGVGRDINNKNVEPILHSHIEGLSPNEFYLHGYDSRKGMADRALSTSEPGAVTRQLWSVNQSETITDKDCNTKEGIAMKKEGAIVGRTAAVNIKGANGRIYVKAGDFISKADKDNICKDDTIDMVKVRSVMTCEVVNGTCQKCYGWEAGKIVPPALGTAIGTLAAQTIGEPMTQMVMRTFHGGGDVSSVSLGMPRVKEVLGMNKDPKNKAVLARVSGVVKSITPHKEGIDIVVGDTVHRVGLNEQRQQKPVRVKIGDKVNKGDFLTSGSADDIRNGVTNLTSVNPRELVEYKEDSKDAINSVQDYLATSMQYAINASLGDADRDAVDRRHIELTVSKLTENVRITESSLSPYVEGDIVKRTEVEGWNKAYASPFRPMEVDVLTKAIDLVGCRSAGTYKDEFGKIILSEGQVISKNDLDEIKRTQKIVKVIPSPIKYRPEVAGIKTAPTIGHENWFSNLGHEDLNRQLARGAAFGQTDKLQDSRSRIMAGKAPSIGKGFNMSKSNKDLSNSFANSIANMFKK